MRICSKQKEGFQEHHLIPAYDIHLLHRHSGNSGRKSFKLFCSWPQIEHVPSTCMLCLGIFLSARRTRPLIPAYWCSCLHLSLHSCLACRQLPSQSLSPLSPVKRLLGKYESLLTYSSWKFHWTENFQITVPFGSLDVLTCLCSYMFAWSEI